MQDTMRYIKSRAKIHNIRRLYEQFQKATMGMDAEGKNTYIDHHVLNYVHHLVHEIEDHAKQHMSHSQNINASKKQIVAMQREQEELHEKVKMLLSKLVEDYGEHRVSDPTAMPQIPHMSEYHDIVPEMARQIAAGKISLDEAADQIIESIEGEIEHDKMDMSSSMFTKSETELFVKNFDPFHYIGVQGNALSVYRPSPTFLMTHYEKPDEEYVNMMVKMKEPMMLRYRVAVPPYSTKELVNRVGVPEYRPLDDIKRQEREQQQAEKMRAMQESMVAGQQPSAPAATQPMPMSEEVV